MAEKKNKPVTLVKGTRKVVTSLPREIVQYKAAGWVEEGTAPVADSPQDVDEAKSAPTAGKGGAKK